jgi:hypothetical protein
MWLKVDINLNNLQPNKTMTLYGLNRISIKKTRRNKNVIIKYIKEQKTLLPIIFTHLQF